MTPASLKRRTFAAGLKSTRSSLERFIPTLTALVQPKEELGREAVKILTDVLASGAHRHIRLQTTLREGGTVRKIS